MSYVRYMSPSQLVTASTDNCVRLWDLRGASPTAAQTDGLTDGPGAARTTAGGGGGGGGGGSGGGALPGGDPKLSMTFSGHLNEKNFVGLSVTREGYIAAGSETNQVYCYYKV